MIDLILGFKFQGFNKSVERRALFIFTFGAHYAVISNDFSNSHGHRIPHEKLLDFGLNLFRNNPGAETIDMVRV
jgi:hypothetical protein